MGSAFDDLFTDSAVPVLMGLHGRTVMRWPDGDESAAETVSAIWSPENTGERDADIQSQRIIIEGTLTIDATQSYSNRDSWIIDGWRYHVEAPGHVQAGLRYIKLKYTDKVTTSRTPNVR